MHRGAIWAVLALSLAACATLRPRPASMEDREAYLADHPTLDPAVQRAIRDGRVVIGMLLHQVEMVYGKPIRGSSTQYKDYAGKPHLRQYLTFVEGQRRVTITFHDFQVESIHR